MSSEAGLAVKSVIDQYERSFTLLRRSIECFDEVQWFNGISPFEVPCTVAYHTLQCLVYYFRTDPATEYRDISPKFGKDWWQLAEEDRPNQSQMLDFLDEVSQIVISNLSGMTDEDLSKPFGATTNMGNIMYSMRHTMHHQGGLNVLSIYHGIDSDLWDK